MTDVSVPIFWGAIRTLIAIGAGWLVGKGWMTQATFNEMITAIMIILPFVWTAAQKYMARKRELLAVNVGIIHAGATALATPEAAATLIKNIGPYVPIVKPKGETP
jgi:hypothetical protein